MGKNNLKEFEASFFAAIELVKIELLLHPEMSVQDLIKKGSIASFDVATWQKIALKRLINGELTEAQSKAFCDLGLDKVKSVVKRAQEKRAENVLSQPEQLKSQTKREKSLSAQQGVDLIRRELEIHPELTIDDIVKIHYVNGEIQYYKIGNWNATFFLRGIRKKCEAGRLDPTIKDQLEALGFNFKLTKFYSLSQGVQRIKEYFSKNPDKTIYDLQVKFIRREGKPIQESKYIDDWNVSNWIHHVKRRLKMGSYSQEEIELLASVGIVADMPRKKKPAKEKVKVAKPGKKGVSVQDGVQRIKQEMQEKGVTLKEMRAYAGRSAYLIDGWNASSWIVNIMAKRKQGKLSDEEVELLKSVGFFPEPKLKSQKPEKKYKKASVRRLTKQEIADIFSTLGISRYSGVDSILERRIKQIHEEFFAHPEITIDDMRAKYDQNGERIDYMIGDWNVSQWIATMQAYLTQGGFTMSEEVLLKSIGIRAIVGHKPTKQEPPPPKIEESDKPAYMREYWEGPAMPETAKPFSTDSTKIDK